MNAIKTIVLTTFLFACFSGKSQETIYNNFGSGHDGWDYNYGLGWTIAGDSVSQQYGVEQAMLFESTTTGFLTDIWLAISYVPMSAFPDTVIVRLAENPNGLPPETADIIAEWTLTEFSSWSQWNTPLHLIGDNITELRAGNTYWLWTIASDYTWAMWCMNEDPAFTCPHAMRREGEDWLSISNETASAFRVDISTVVGLPSKDSETGIRLSQNYPNPFSSSTNISYALDTPDHVKIVIYDLSGNECKVLVDADQEAGQYELTIHAGDLSAGMYICSLQTAHHSTARIKMHRIK